MNLETNKHLFFKWSPASLWGTKVDKNYKN